MEKQDDTLRQTLSTWINTQNMQPIVDKITPLIWTDINIADSEGIIVASSKPHRIGKYHNAAKGLIEGKEEQLIVERTNDIPGVLHGVNYPICIEGVRVGMIGITGEPEKVQLIAKLVRELLQFHIATARKNEEQSFLVQLRYRFLYEWLFDKDTVVTRAFRERGEALGIGVSRAWTVGVIAQQDEVPHQSGQQMERLQYYVRKCRDQWDQEGWFIFVGNEIILLIQEPDPGRAAQLMRGIQTELRQHVPGMFPAGVGRSTAEPERIRQSLRDARLMCRMSKYRTEHEVCCFEEAHLELLLLLAPEEELTELFWRIFRDFSRQELEQTMEMLQLYVVYNGSISRVSEALQIHKNTLQYRLNRLAKMTGYVPQHISDMSFLYVLMKIYDLEIRNAGKEEPDKPGKKDSYGIDGCNQRTPEH